MSNTSINETFIIEGIGEGPDFSACTAIFSNEIKSCSGNTIINLGENIIVFNGNLLAPSVSATTFYGDGSNLTGISKQDIFVTGGTYNNGTIIFTNNTGGTFSVSGFSITTPFTGGTVSGATIFTNGLSASTISATTYNGYVPYDSTNPNGYISGITSGNVTTALGYTPYDSTNPNGYITAFTGGTVSGPTIFTNGLIANTISATTYENVAHNSTTGLQGGLSGGTGEYYHLTASQQTRVLNLIYSGQVTTFTINTNSGERGIPTSSLSLNYRMIAGDDIYTGATINPGNFPAIYDGIQRNQSLPTNPASAATTTYTLNYGFTRNGVPNTAAISQNYTTLVPQWFGNNAAFSAATTYAAVTGLTLTKVLTTNRAYVYTLPIVTNKYIWFISIYNNLSITSGLPLKISLLDVYDPTAFFQLRTFNLTLADGVTTATTYTYISTITKTTFGPENYTIS